MNVYDFDKTIYKGDSTIDFYFWCLKKKPLILFLLPIQIFGFILYKSKIRNKEYFKERFYIFLKYMNVSEKLIDLFWKDKKKNICDWYLKQKKETDVIISASPEFLLKPLIKELNIKNIIASKVDEKTGKLMGKNCYGKEKVIRYKEIYFDKKIVKFYSDSISDLPLANISKESFLVNLSKNEFIRFPNIKS